MKKVYIFLAYKSETDYPIKPFHTKIFEDFDEMKTYSGKHSYKYRNTYSEYCSTYTKAEL